MDVTLRGLTGPGFMEERLRLTAAPIGTPAGETRTYRDGRVCEVYGCKTILSRYNRGSLCWQHESPRPYFGPVRGRHRRDVPVVDDLTSLIA